MNKSPFDRVDVTTLTTEEREKICDPNYRITGKMEVKEKTFGSKSGSKNKDPEDKVYIVFIVSEINGHNCSYISNYDHSSNLTVNGEFSVRNGRSDTYNFIKDILTGDTEGNINVNYSFVLVEGLSCTNSISMFKFMKHCEEIFTDDDFNIDDYDENPNNDIHETNIPAIGNSMSLVNSILNNNKEKENEENGSK